MGTTSTALPVPASRFSARKAWVAVAAAAVLAGGTAGGIALSRGEPATTVGSADTRAYEGSPVTGTGPGLTQVAGPREMAGPTDRGSVSPRHHTSRSDALGARAGGGQRGDARCGAVTGRPFC
jgi:hypothetical protein